MYDVVQVGDEIKVVAVKALKDEQKRAKTENDKAMKEWKRAKKSDPSTPKPTSLIVKVLKRNIKSKEDADSACQDLKDKLDKKEESKPAPKSKT